METVGNRHLPRVRLWYPLCQTWPPCLVGACMGRAHDGGLVCLHAAVTVGPPPALLSGGAATMASTSWQSAPGSSQHHTPSL